jgi:signal transduction histidine kinase
VVRAFDNASQERLLRALAEQLKTPLIQIARTAELAAVSDDVTSLRHIEYTADMALRLVDSYLLSVQLQALPSLELEPVSVSAILQDTAHRLNRLAKQNDCELEVHLSGKYEPVMAHRQSLEAAYATLGYAFIESIPPSDTAHRLILGAHRSQRGVVAGVFGDQPGLNADMFRRARALYGNARQALPSASPGSGAGVFVADSLLQNMSTNLRLARHHNMSGLAATFLSSRQLQLV